MGDERNDGWHHRSQFAPAEDPCARGVTREVNERRYGAAETPHPNELRADTDDADEPDPNEAAREKGYADKWAYRFRHLPGVERER